MIYNVALDSAFLNLRGCNEYFEPWDRPGVIRADHFPLQSMQPFLSPDEELAIHKHLAHLTITRSDRATMS